MDFLVWDDGYRTGHRQVDLDHENLFALVNRLTGLTKDGAASDDIAFSFEILANYVRFHFTREEEILEASAYPSLDDHKEAHRQLAAQFEEHHDAFATDPATFDFPRFVSFLGDWLENHILRTDMAYVPHLEESGSLR